MIDASLWGNSVSYQRGFGIADGQVEVASLVTGETKIAFRYTPVSVHPPFIAENSAK